MESIRVLHVLSGLWIGGVQRFLLNYYTHINRNKIQFDFVVMGSTVGCYEDEIIKMGGRIFHIDSISENRNRFKSNFKKFLREHPEYRIVHAHMNFLNGIILQCAKCCGVPKRISHSHANYPASTFIVGIARILIKLQIKYCTTDYYACSMLAGKWLYGNNIIKTNKFKIIHNSIDMNKFLYNDLARKETRNKLDVNEDAFVVIHTGSLSGLKNHMFLLEVFKEIHKKNNNSALLLIGDGDLLNKINEWIENNNLSKKVFILGYQEYVAPFLMAGDIFVFPSLAEGLGISVVEAQTTGLPCYVSEALPTEVQITDRIFWNTLNDSPSVWAEKILKNNIDKNRNMAQYIENSIYNINTQTILLEKEYIDNNTDIIRITV